MAMKINLPDFNRSKGYGRYKQEVLAWCLVTEIPKGKQGIAIALSLPDDHESDLRDKFFDELTLDYGFDTLAKFLDESLVKMILHTASKNLRILRNLEEKGSICK